MKKKYALQNAVSGLFWGDGYWVDSVIQAELFNSEIDLEAYMADEDAFMFTVLIVVTTYWYG